MTNHILTLTDGNGRKTLEMEIPPVAPILAMPAICAALSTLPAPAPKRKTRSDAGIPRKPKPATAAA